MNSTAVQTQRTINAVALAETARNASAMFAIGAMLAHRSGQLKMPRPDAYIKRITRPMLGFKTFRCARVLLAGIEVMHIIRKGQLSETKGRALSAANRFYSLAF